jgi:hypothetical protein
MTGKYGQLIKNARENQRNLEIPENQNDGIPETASAPAVAEVFVNLSIKVPLEHRQHWAAEAKRNGTSLTKAITESLTQRFGLPQS